MRFRLYSIKRTVRFGRSVEEVFINGRRVEDEKTKAKVVDAAQELDREVGEIWKALDRFWVGVDRFFGKIRRF